MNGYTEADADDKKEVAYSLVQYELLGLVKFWYEEWWNYRESTNITFHGYYHRRDAYSMAFAADRIRHIVAILGEERVDKAMASVDWLRARQKRTIAEREAIAKIRTLAVMVEKRRHRVLYIFGDGSVLGVEEGMCGEADFCPQFWFASTADKDDYYANTAAPPEGPWGWSQFTSGRIGRKKREGEKRLVLRQMAVDEPPPPKEDATDKGGDPGKEKS